MATDACVGGAATASAADYPISNDGGAPDDVVMTTSVDSTVHDLKREDVAPTNKEAKDISMTAGRQILQETDQVGGIPPTEATCASKDMPTEAPDATTADATKASAELPLHERYSSLQNRMKDNKEYISRVEIEHEVRILFTNLYNGIRNLAKPKKADANYPELSGEEAEGLVDLFTLMAKQQQKSFQEWRRVIQDLCKDLHRSTWTVSALIQKRIDQQKLSATPSTTPWGSQTSEGTNTERSSATTQAFKFNGTKYSSEEQKQMVDYCREKFEYTPTIREPTDQEWAIMIAILEGDLLIRHLPQFLRRVCDEDNLFRFQNTIAAQVEGELVGQLADFTQIYKDHQTTERIVEAILQAARFRNDNKMDEIMAMLRDLKAAEYNDSTHSLHFFFFDRETANKWAKATIPFRRQLVQLKSAHDTDPQENHSKPSNVWSRQLGADGLENASSRTRYKIQLLNISRTMNVALLFEYIKQETKKKFYAYALDAYGPRSRKSQHWELLFEEETCPKLLVEIQRINWKGRVIIVHHASRHRIEPCLICGAAGHFARDCKATERELATKNCIRVEEEKLTRLPRKPTTFTSVEEMKSAFAKSLVAQQDPTPTTDNPEEQQTDVATAPRASKNQQQPNVEEWKIQGRQGNTKVNDKLWNNARGTLQHQKNQQSRAISQPSRADKEKATNNTSAEGGTANQHHPKRQQQVSNATVTKEDIKSAKELLRYRRDMNDLIKVHMVDANHLNPNRNDIMDWDGDYTLRDVLDANGLSEAQTPKTGNCQFYAIAEAMLQITHDNPANEKLLEATAGRIKKSMQEAARLHFDIEFPAGTHLGIIQSLGRGGSKMTEEERKQDVLNYFDEVAKSSSSRATTLPGPQWGGPESLRMAAKALQRKIYVLIETNYGDRKGYAIYTPKQKALGGTTFLSAKEQGYDGRTWVEELRKDRSAAETNNEPLPIVLKFAEEHYNSMHFKRMEMPQEVPKTFVSSLSKHLESPDIANMGYKTNRSGQFEIEPEAEDIIDVATPSPNDPVDEITNVTDPNRPWLHPKWTGNIDDLKAALNNPAISHHEKLQLNDMLTNGLTQTRDLTNFMQAGYDQLNTQDLDQHKKLDKSNNIETERLVGRDKSLRGTLEQWKSQQQFELISQTSSEPTIPSNGSIWMPPANENSQQDAYTSTVLTGWELALTGNQEVQMIEASQEVLMLEDSQEELVPIPGKRDRETSPMQRAVEGAHTINLYNPNVLLKKNRTIKRTLAAEGNTIQERKATERLLEEHWESYQPEWNQEPTCSFPTLSARPEVWSKAAVCEWERIFEMLRASPGPHYILNHLRVPILVDLTQALREQVIEAGLHRLSLSSEEAETKLWVMDWFARINSAQTPLQRAAILNSKENWQHLRKMKYGGIDTLRLSQPSQREKLSYYIICALVYEEEIQLLNTDEAKSPKTAAEGVEMLISTVKQSKELKVAFKKVEELGEWSGLSILMSQLSAKVDAIVPTLY